MDARLLREHRPLRDTSSLLMSQQHGRHERCHSPGVRWGKNGIDGERVQAWCIFLCNMRVKMEEQEELLFVGTVSLHWQQLRFR